VEEGLKSLLTNLLDTQDSPRDEEEGTVSAMGDSEEVDEVSNMEKFISPSKKKFSSAVQKVMIVKTATTVLDREDSQEIWPATAAWFLGPKSENLELLQALVNKAIEEHAEFRKYKYFPLDPEYVTGNIERHPAFTAATEDLRNNLDLLCQRLKNSVPFSSFRSQGHMLWDTTIASNVGYIAALLYNQNNVASMASGVTLQLEREAAKDLCGMVGYNIYDEDEHTTENPVSWGHLPNGGTVANLEAMWAARSIKFNGLTMQKMMKEYCTGDVLGAVHDTFEFVDLQGEKKKLKDASAWELLNLPVDEGIDLFDKIVHAINEREKEVGQTEFTTLDSLFALAKEYTLEELGGLSFFGQFGKELAESNIKMGGKWFCPGSRHYSWDKGANILGIGRRNLIKVPVDKNCRMDTEFLKNELEKCLEERWPVIGVTVVFGTTQEGAVDDLERILEIRKYFAEKGLTFYIHIDGAWGGYFASVIQPNPDNQGVVTMVKRKVSVTYSTMFNESLLSTHFEKQLRCLKNANSITLDPHKSGFCPYPAGGLLYRNGNIRKFLAQKAAYVNHGTQKNEEINLFGIDGSKPGAASAGVWLSHKVTGLHCDGYGLLLRQSSFSAGVMYAMWVSMSRSKDPFLIVPGIPIREKCAKAWTKMKIRKEILKAENYALNQNKEAMDFIRENGPDTLINCLSINFREWDSDGTCGGGKWINNTSMEKQREFLNKFYKRCSHSYERPSMVDRGIQIILNSTTWEEESHSEVYKAMKDSLGLDPDEDGKLGVVINTCMTPWLRAQKTFQRMSVIIRNELYNAYGAMTDQPEKLNLVSPCNIDQDWDGSVFAELEASFSKPNLRYHAIGKYMFNLQFCEQIREAANRSNSKVMRIQTVKEMKVFDLMTGGDDSGQYVNQMNSSGDEVDHPMHKKPTRQEKIDAVKAKLDEYSDNNLQYEDIAMPEIEVWVYFDDGENTDENGVAAMMKMKRVIRYHHLTRDFVDEKGYPPTQEYFLYSDEKNAYLSHCPNRYPDFQQLIHLDEIPTPFNKGNKDEKDEKDEKAVLYQEALERGVVVYLPEISTGGKPPEKKRSGQYDDRVCRDPIKRRTYNAISWSDQGAFTGEMTSICVKFLQNGKRWFDGKKINQNFEDERCQKFGYLYDESLYSDEDTDEESDNES